MILSGEAAAGAAVSPALAARRATRHIARHDRSEPSTRHARGHHPRHAASAELLADMVHAHDARRARRPRRRSRKLKDAVAKTGVTLEKLLVTHGHLDDCGQAGVLAKELGLPIEGPHEADRFWISRLDDDGHRWGMEAHSFEPDRWLEDGDTVTVGELGVRIGRKVRFEMRRLRRENYTPLLARRFCLSMKLIREPSTQVKRPILLAACSTLPSRIPLAWLQHTALICFRNLGDLDLWRG